METTGFEGKDVSAWGRLRSIKRFTLKPLTRRFEKLNIIKLMSILFLFIFVKVGTNIGLVAIVTFDRI
jgi:hypothetical protein